MVWRSAELPLAAGRLGGQLLALTTASPLPAPPLQVQALPKEICADAGLSRKPSGLPVAQTTPPSLPSVLSSAIQPFPHQGTPVLGPATPPLAGGLYHMTNCAPPPGGCACCGFFQNCSGGKFGMPGRSEGTRPRVLPLF